MNKLKIAVERHVPGECKLCQGVTHEFACDGCVLAAALSAAEARVRELGGELATEIGEHGRTRADRDRLQAENETLHANVVQYVTELGDLQTKVDGLRAQFKSVGITPYLDRMTELQARHEKAESQLASLQADKNAALVVIEYERRNKDLTVPKSGEAGVFDQRYLDAKRRLGL